MRKEQAIAYDKWCESDPLSRTSHSAFLAGWDAAIKYTGEKYIKEIEKKVAELTDIIEGNREWTIF
jgi:hypothetical protein